MVKHTTNSYVFKFVGGDGLLRPCHFCRRRRQGGMIAVYGNDIDGPPDTIFVCPRCAVRGCKESVLAWKRALKRARAAGRP